MASPTLLSMAAISTVAALVYLLVARDLGKRPVSGEAGMAHTAFRVWWIALALSTLAGTVLPDLLVAYDTLPLALMVAIQYGSTGVICVALAGLLYYLVYLYTGRRNAWKPIVGFYLLYFVFIVAAVYMAQPKAVVVERYSATLEYVNPLRENAAVFFPLLLLLVGPQILAALAYFFLVFRVEDNTARYRVVLVSLSILVWFGTALLAALTPLGAWQYWPIMSRLIGLGAALVVFGAYHPPGLVRKVFGVRSVKEDAPAAEPDTSARTWSDDRGPFPVVGARRMGVRPSLG